MGKHKEWRKVAKKMRRKKIRSGLAQQRDELETEEEEKRKMSPTYEKLIAEEKSLLIAAQETEMKELEVKLKKWQEEEERVKEETMLREALLKELEEKNEKARIEKVQAEKELLEKEIEKKTRIADCLQNFASGVIDVLPDDMLIPLETQPGKEKCLFFHKVGACKFWDACSRNHIRPAISKVLLFPGFYTHFSMSLLVQSEYDTDMSLEFDEKETYSHFEEFYQDIRSEFEKYGRLTNLMVCCNREVHLRGNVYVSYSTEREAMTAYLKFNGRYYAGKVISCHFVNIPSWKSAICGLYFKQKCPKGDACNFLHVFKDPGPPFYKLNEDRSSSSDEWRWSVSPENEKMNDYERKGSDNKRKRRMWKSRSRSPDYRRSRSSERRAITSYRQKPSRTKEFSENCRKRPNEQNRKHKESRSHSNDRNRSHSSDKRYTYRDKHSSRKLKSKRTNTNRRSRSRSLSRDNRRKRGEESTHRRRSISKNRSKFKERVKHRSSSSSSGISDNETSSSGKSSMNSHN